MYVVFGAVSVLHVTALLSLPHAQRRSEHPPIPVEVDVAFDESLAAATTTEMEGRKAPSQARRGAPSDSARPGSNVRPGPNAAGPDILVTPSDDGAVADSHVEAGGGLFLLTSPIGLSGPGSYRMEIAKQQPVVPTDAERAAEIMNQSIRNVFHDPAATAAIVNGLESVTRRSDGAPFEGHAVFDIRIDAVGLVVNIDVADASGDRAAWNEVAASTLNALAQKRLHVPHGANGMALRIEVTSAVTLPSGAHHGFEVDQNPLVGKFDLSDIGAHPLRVVSARMVSERLY